MVKLLRSDETSDLDQEQLIVSTRVTCFFKIILITKLIITFVQSDKLEQRRIKLNITATHVKSIYIIGTILSGQT